MDIKKKKKCFNIFRSLHKEDLERTVALILEEVLSIRDDMKTFSNERGKYRQSRIRVVKLKEENEQLWKNGKKRCEQLYKFSNVIKGNAEDNVETPKKRPSTP